jgi:hypothetical protein
MEKKNKKLKISKRVKENSKEGIFISKVPPIYPIQRPILDLRNKNQQLKKQNDSKKVNFEELLNKELKK